MPKLAVELSRIIFLHGTYYVVSFYQMVIMYKLNLSVIQYQDQNYTIGLFAVNCKKLIVNCLP